MVYPADKDTKHIKDQITLCFVFNFIVCAMCVSFLISNNNLISTSIVKQVHTIIYYGSSKFYYCNEKCFAFQKAKKKFCLKALSLRIHLSWNGKFIFSTF